MRNQIILSSFFTLTLVTNAFSQEEGRHDDHGRGDSKQQVLQKSLSKSQSSVTQIIDRVVASVDGEPYTLRDLKHYIVLQGDTKTTSPTQDPAQLSKYLRAMIGDRLLTKEAEAVGISIGEDQIQKYIDEVKRQNKVDDAGLERLLKSRGISLEDYKRQVATDILRARIISAKVRSRVNIVDEDIKKYFQLHPERLPASGQVHLVQILLRSKEQTPVKSLEEQIAAIRQQLVQGGDWAEVGGKNFSDLGYLKTEDLRPELQIVVEHLSAGVVSEVIHSAIGYHLLKVINRNEGKNIELSPDLKEEVRQELLQEKMKEEFEKYVEEELPKKYNVEIKL